MVPRARLGGGMHAAKLCALRRDTVAVPLVPLSTTGLSVEQLGEMENKAKQTILLLDDEIFVLLDLEDAVQAAGHSAMLVGDVPTALTSIAHERIDGAILDISLAGTTCIDVARALEERHIPFIFYTGEASPLPEAFGRLRADVLRKPQSPRDVVGAALVIMETDARSGGDG